MSPHLHIVSFDVPYPPNYGGIVDVFYKLKALHAVGVQVTFHCFYYKGHNPPSSDLNPYCHEIFYYPRKKHLSKLILSQEPFITASRSDVHLLERLKADNHPILFEGIQSCYFLSHPDLKNRKKYVRAHNIEHDYYLGLAASEKNKIKQRYFKWEAKKLKAFEPQLAHASGIFSIAKMDVPHFETYAPTYHIPPFFHSFPKQWDLEFSEEKYILFHGNLSVSENQKAVDFILKKIVPKSPYEFKIAGKNPPLSIKNQVSKWTHVQLIENPSDVSMQELIEDAHVNLLLTFQQTGVKLKLLHAIESGKHVLINTPMDDSELFSNICQVANSPKEISAKLDELMAQAFTFEDFQNRLKIFHLHFDNDANAKTIKQIVFQ